MLAFFVSVGFGAFRYQFAGLSAGVQGWSYYTEHLPTTANPANYRKKTLDTQKSPFPAVAKTTKTRTKTEETKKNRKNYVFKAMHFQLVGYEFSIQKDFLFAEKKEKKIR